MTLRDKKILVTGSDGLIGRPVCRMLFEEGATVFPFDLVHGFDVTNYHHIDDAVRTWKPDGVIHLAAVSNIHTSRDEPLKHYQVNLMGAINVLESCRVNGKVPVIIASSNHVYGEPISSGPTSEYAELYATDTYSMGKVCADKVAQSYCEVYDMKVGIIRNTNCYGPDDPHSDHLIPSTILSILEGKPIVLRGDGETRKSYLYVDDVARAYLMLMDWLPTGRWPAIFNIADESVSTRYVVYKICEAMGVERNITTQNTDGWQIDEWLDTELAKDVLGWKPEYTLEEGIRKTVEGFRARQPV